MSVKQILDNKNFVPSA